MLLLCGVGGVGVVVVACGVLLACVLLWRVGCCCVVWVLLWGVVVVACVLLWCVGCYGVCGCLWETI